MKRLSMLIILLRLYVKSYVMGGKCYDLKFVSGSSNILRKTKYLRIMKVSRDLYRVGNRLYSYKKLFKLLLFEFDDLYEDVLFIDAILRYSVLYDRVGGWRKFVVRRAFKVNGWMDGLDTAKDKSVVLENVDYEFIEEGLNKYDFFSEEMKDELYGMLKFEPLKLRFYMILTMFWISFFGIKNMWFLRRLVLRRMRSIIRRVMGVYKLGLKRKVGFQFVGLVWDVEILRDEIVATDGVEKYKIKMLEAELHGVVGGVICDRFALTGYLEFLSGKARNQKLKENKKVIKELISDLDYLESKWVFSEGREKLVVVREKYEVIYRGYVSFKEELNDYDYNSYFSWYYGEGVKLTEEMLNGAVCDLVWYYGKKLGFSEYWRVVMMSKVCFSGWCVRRRRFFIVIGCLKIGLVLSIVIGWVEYNIYMIKMFFEYWKEYIEYLRLKCSFKKLVLVGNYLWECLVRGFEAFLYRIYMLTFFQIRIVKLKVVYEWLRRKLNRGRSICEKDISGKYGGSARGIYEEEQIEEEEDEGRVDELEVHNSKDVELTETEFMGRYKTPGEYNEGLDMGRSTKEYWEYWVKRESEWKESERYRRRRVEESLYRQSSVQGTKKERRKRRW